MYKKVYINKVFRAQSVIGQKVPKVGGRKVSRIFYFFSCLSFLIEDYYDIACTALGLPVSSPVFLCYLSYQALKTKFFVLYLSLLQAERGLSIVMQYAEGGTMDNMISERKGVKFSESTVLKYFTQVFGIYILLSLPVIL